MFGILHCFKCLSATFKMSNPSRFKAINWIFVRYRSINYFANLSPGLGMCIQNVQKYIVCVQPCPCCHRFYLITIPGIITMAELIKYSALYNSVAMVTGLISSRHWTSLLFVDWPRFFSRIRRVWVTAKRGREHRLEVTACNLPNSTKDTLALQLPFDFFMVLTP